MAERERDIRERDILVASNEYAYVQDLTKGDIVLYVGPTKISLSNTERLVEYRGGRFVPVRAEDSSLGVNPNIVASSSQYIILENPPRGKSEKPNKGSNSAIELVTGKRIVEPGPATFPLWPGQTAHVIDGHELRENEYLVIRVYDHMEGDESPIGTEKIIRGSDVSFYIPRTGLEVLPGKEGYVRKAVTLLDGEYCILQAPNGKRTYRRGPAVIFPEPMEEFVEQNSSCVFKAYHLKKTMGLVIRVVRDFELTAEDQVPAGSYSAGKELFIKEREGFFYPTENLEVLSVVSPIPLGEKEGIYVRDLESGTITTETGPRNYLPDPTRQEVVKRQLPELQRKLYKLPGYDGSRAVSVYIPPSFAVLVTARNKREVVLGPQTRILDYDEDLEILKLSMGKPKSDENVLRRVFLRISGNKVSDIVHVTTRDHVELNVTLSYRVTFKGDLPKEREKWFDVKDFVGLLCDHMGSIIRGVVQGVSVEAFHSNSTEIIRGAVLGEKHGEEKRAGRFFQENGMLVYDLEVLDMEILDPNVETLLAGAQRTAIESDVQLRKEELRLGNEKLKQDVDRQIYEAQMVTLEKAVSHEEALRALAETKARARMELEKLEKVGRAHNEAEALEITMKAKVDAARKESEVVIEGLNARVEAFRNQMGALSPDLVATMKALGDQHMATELTKNLSPLAILGGTSVAEVATRLLQSLPLGLSVVEGKVQAIQPPAAQPPAKK